MMIKKLVALFLHLGAIVMLVLVSVSATKNIDASFNLLAVIPILFFFLIMYFSDLKEEVFLQKMWLSGWLVFAISLVLSISVILLHTSLGGYAFLLAFISALAFLIL